MRLRESMVDSINGLPAQLERLVSAFESHGLNWPTVRESLLVDALVASLSINPEIAVMTELRIPAENWDPQPGAVDIAVADKTSGALGVIEAKWCTENTLAEMLWDTLKLVDLPDDRVATRMLVYGASATRHWGKCQSTEALAAGRYFDSDGPLTVSTRAFVGTNDGKDWAWLLGGGGARIIEAPAEIIIEPIARQLISIGGAEDYEIRAIEVRAGGEAGHVSFSKGWPA